MNYKEIGKRLMMLKAESGLNQTEFAAIIGVSQSMLSRYMRAKAKISIEDLNKLCDYFKKPIDYFVKNTATLVEKPKPKFNQPITTDMDAKFVERYLDSLERKDRHIDRLLAMQEELIAKIPNANSLGEEKGGKASNG